MIPYEFQCPVCQRVFTVDRDPDKPKRAKCPDCGAAANRVFSPSAFRISWANGPDDINLGLGEHFKSNRERDYFADSKGLKKV